LPSGDENLCSRLGSAPTRSPVNVAGPGVTLTARGRPFMTSAEAGRTRYEVLLPAPPTANGAALPPIGRYELARLAMAAPGLDIAVEAPVVLIVERDGVTIRRR
jgi:hypothetical protein